MNKLSNSAMLLDIETFLKQEIAEMENLLAACETAPGSASQQLIDECQAALQTAFSQADPLRMLLRKILNSAASMQRTLKISPFS